MESRTGVYAIWNTANDCVYIGEASAIESRWRVHRDQLRLGNHPLRTLQADWGAYGPEAFEWIVLEPLPVDRERDEAEQYWIDLFRLDGCSLYNENVRVWNRDPYKHVSILEHPRRSRPPCFGYWLTVQHKRDDEIGDLARWLVKDASWSRLAQSLHRLEEVLRHKDASTEQFTALHRAWQEYLNSGGWVNRDPERRKLARLFGVPMDSIRLPKLNGTGEVHTQ